jgi:hypothetical protein
MNKRETLWEAPEDDPKVDTNRPLSLSRPCTCGTCSAGKAGVGYISGSINGQGVTIWIKDRTAYNRMKKLFKANGLSADR